MYLVLARGRIQQTPSSGSIVDNVGVKSLSSEDTANHKQEIDTNTYRFSTYFSSSPYLGKDHCADGSFDKQPGIPGLYLGTKYRPTT